jgi:hypothetical protein
MIRLAPPLMRFIVSPLSRQKRRSSLVSTLALTYSMNMREPQD